MSTVDTVDTVDTVSTVDTVDRVHVCLSICGHGEKGRIRFRKSSGAWA